VIVFNPGDNCWRTSEAAFATLLIDCDDFYRALHQAIRKAQHSIFVVGWDIDSRIRLLRGDEERNSSFPSVISELLAKKARKNPHLKVYLLRWDSSLAFFKTRELLLKQIWDQQTPHNVHTRLDGKVPMGACQHQKIILVDDEVAFSGGMDVAVQRWDTREHPIEAPERKDEEGAYGPFHDVQIMVAGPVVGHLAELVRWRWGRVADIDAVPIRPVQRYSLNVPPPAWPDGFAPVFRKIPCAIARTLPAMDDMPAVQEVRRMYLNLIAGARDFIYLENQFASRREIAEALNARLKACEPLRVVVVSTFRPTGTVECEAYWASRIDFKRILEQGIEKNRVGMLYSSLVDEQGNFADKHIHSKVAAIDDNYLIVGSANLTNRSMSLDTECDLVFAAANSMHRQQIAQARNDLIGEHCGRSAAQVSKLLARDKGLEPLLQPARQYAYRLKEVQDELFTDKSLQTFMQPFSDPEEPMMPPLPLLNGRRFLLGNPSRKLVLLFSLFALFGILLGLTYLVIHSVPGFNTENIRAFLEHSRDTWWGLPAVCLVYVIGGMLFFPVTVLSLAVAAIFGPLWGPVYGICGALLSAALLFGAGHLLGLRGLRKIGGSKVRMLDEKFRRSGILGVAALRLIPIAPYSLVNLVAGISSIGLFQFMAGTFLGMFPTMLAKGLVGDSLAQLFVEPTPIGIGYLAGGMVCWVGVAVISQKLVNYFQRQRMA
jgi:phospholipase D1/2